MPTAKQKKYYAVRSGRTTGLFDTWDQCKKQIMGYPNAIYKSFTTLQEAEAYLQGDAGPRLDGSTALTAYVDGSFVNGIRRIGYGVVILKNGEDTIQLKGALTEPSLLPYRNVAGEVYAAMAAMQYAVEHGEPELIIWHDYEGIAAWCTGGWAANAPLTQQYKAFYQSVAGKLTV